MDILFERIVGSGRTAFVGCTTKLDGDLSMSTVAARELADRRSAIVDLPWLVCRQVHSDRVVGRQAAGSPAVADAVLVQATGRVAAVHSADCVPVAFVHDGGAIAAAHAGWRGLERGVLESTARALRAQGLGRIQAVVGPHIHPASYEFGTEPLERLANRFGSGVVGATSTQTPALNLGAAVRSELDRLDVEVAVESPDCTAVEADRYWSYRARRESGRFALLAWMIDG